MSKVTELPSAVLAGTMLLLSALDAGAVDSDGDAIPDAADNCIESANPAQQDQDHDGFGNACDADFDGNGVVNFTDVARMRMAFFQQDPLVDLDGDGVVNFKDLARLRMQLFRSPGPSGALLPPMIFFDSVAHGDYLDPGSVPSTIGGSVPNLAGSDGEILVQSAPGLPFASFAPPLFDATLGVGPVLSVLVDATRFSTQASSRERIVLVRGHPLSSGEAVPGGLRLRLNDRAIDQLEVLIQRAVAPLADDFEAELQARFPIDFGDGAKLSLISASLDSIGVEAESQADGLHLAIALSDFSLAIHAQIPVLSDCDGKVSFDRAVVRGSIEGKVSPSEPGKAEFFWSRKSDPQVEFSGFDEDLDCGLLNPLPAIKWVVDLFVDGAILEDPLGDAIESFLRDRKSGVFEQLEAAVSTVPLDAEITSGLSLHGELEAVAFSAGGLTVDAAVRAEDSDPDQVRPGLERSNRGVGAELLFPSTTGNPYGIGLALRDGVVNQLFRSAADEGAFDAEGAFPTPPELALLFGPNAKLSYRLSPTLAPLIANGPGPAGERMVVEAPHLLLEIFVDGAPLLRMAVDATIGLDLGLDSKGAMLFRPGRTLVRSFALTGLPGLAPAGVDALLARFDFGSLLEDKLDAELAARFAELVPAVQLPRFRGADLNLVGPPSWSGTAGRILLLADLVAHPPVAGGGEPKDAFGQALAGGDFDRDGFRDLVVGVPGEGVDRTNIPGAPAWEDGAVNVLYGTREGLTSKRNQLWSQNSGGVPGESEVDDEFGRALATGDFDGDGYDDVAIGVPGEDLEIATPLGTVTFDDVGSLRVLYGGPGGLGTARARSFSLDSAGIPGSPDDGDRFGRSLAAGDFNRDGRADLAVGVPGDASGAGSVVVLLGSASGLTASGARLLQQGTGGLPGASEAGDAFGGSLAAGDLNGDGFAELVVGAPGEGVGSSAPGAGALTVLQGSASGPVAATARIWHQDSTGVPGGAESNDQFGASLTVGDLDGDGYGDLAVGAPGEDVNGAGDAGFVVVLFGSPSGPTAAGRFLGLDQGSGSDAILGAAQLADRFGQSLDAGDFDGDGFDDLAVGIPGETIGRLLGAGTLAGAVQVFYGNAVGLGTAGNQIWHQESDGIEDRSQVGDGLGSSLAAADFDGDGVVDLAVGVPGENAAADEDAGAVNVLYGQRGSGALGQGGIGSARDQIWSQNK